MIRPAPGSGGALLEIHFEDRKYGRELLVDAAAVHHLSGFITDPRPHRLFFYDITFVTNARGRIRLDSRDYAIGPHHVVFTSRGQIRSWLLEEELTGFAVFFRPEFFLTFLAAPRFLGTIPGFRSGSPAVFPLESGVFTDLVRQVQELILEIKEGRPATDDLVHGTVYRLLLDLRRRLDRDTGPALTRAGASSTVVERYLELLDQEPRADRTVRECAARLGVSPGYLNRLTQRQLGLEASRVAQDRLMIEAQRLLRFTELTVSQVAWRLGFSDPAYFARFFRTHRGESPRAFRTRNR
jgi:AraC-like DNA-binding protein